MSLSENGKVLWSDIEALYTTLNTVQTRHQVTNTTKPNNQNKIASANDAKALVNAIEALGTAATQITTSQADVAGTIPSVGDLLEPTIFRNCETTLQTLNGIAFRSGNFNFTSFSSHGHNVGFTYGGNTGGFGSNVGDGGCGTYCPSRQ